MNNIELWVVPTPIGNLKDITFRAIDILGKVDWIVCEDTRHTSILLKTYKINKPLYVINKWNEIKVAPILLKKLLSGKFNSIAIVCSAGTPSIQDPGRLFINLCIKSGVKVSALPGPCAALVAISASGIECDSFLFKGFLDRKKTKNEDAISNFSSADYTVVLYESPHRILKTLESLGKILGLYRKIVIARELTKVWEQFNFGTIEEIIGRFHSKIIPTKGEFVILIEPALKNNKEFLNDISRLTKFNLHDTIDTLSKRIGISETFSILASLFRINKKNLKELVNYNKNNLFNKEI